MVTTYRPVPEHLRKRRRLSRRLIREYEVLSTGERKVIAPHKPKHIQAMEDFVDKDWASELEASRPLGEAGSKAGEGKG